MTKKKNSREKIEIQKGEISFDDNKLNYKFQTPQICLMEDIEDSRGRQSGKDLKKMSRGGY